MVLKITPSSVSLGNLKTNPGPMSNCYCVKINNVPKGISVAQVILLFAHTVKKNADKGQKYEFEFSDLSPLV